MVCEDWLRNIINLLYTMIKYANFDVVMAEVPDEITLAINITNCPCNCPGCHSSYLAKDIGDELTESALDQLIKLNEGITCVALMGGDIDPRGIKDLLKYVKETHKLRTCWYSGRNLQNYHYEAMPWLDYLKVGPYDKSRGPLDSRTTNQVMFKLENHENATKMINITNRFWKK